MNTITGDHESTISDYTAVVLEPVIPLQDDGTTSVNKHGSGWNEGGVAYTLNTVDHISVAYGFQKSINGIDAEEEKQPLLQADTHTKAYTVDMDGGKSSVCTYQEQSPTLACTHYGEPAVAYTLKIRGGCDTYMKWDGKQGTAGKGALIQIEKSATLAVAQDQVLFQPADVRGGEQRER